MIARTSNRGILVILNKNGLCACCHIAMNIGHCPRHCCSPNRIHATGVIGSCVVVDHSSYAAVIGCGWNGNGDSGFTNSVVGANGYIGRTSNGRGLIVHHRYLHSACVGIARTIGNCPYYIGHSNGINTRSVAAVVIIVDHARHNAIICCCWNRYRHHSGAKASGCINRNIGWTRNDWNNVIQNCYRLIAGRCSAIYIGYRPRHCVHAQCIYRGWMIVHNRSYAAVVRCSWCSKRQHRTRA